MKLLLDACCGPCLIEPFDALSGAYEVDVLFANPNIDPESEWIHRRDTLLVYTGARGIAVIERPRDPGAWLRATAGLEGDPGRRCRACYRVRMAIAAQEATIGGYDAFATTLTVSPYQDVGAIREAAEEAAGLHGTSYLHRDFRDRYSEATRRSREAGMYRQNYCGCAPSLVEADREREERRRLRRELRAHE